MKQWVQIENFSSKSALSVEQDFYAKIVTANLTALMRLAAQEKVSKKTRHCRHDYQVNFTHALSTMKHRLVELILCASHDVGVLIEETIRAVANALKCEARS